jgi:hypothetical protein
LSLLAAVYSIVSASPVDKEKVSHTISLGINIKAIGYSQFQFTKEEIQARQESYAKVTLPTASRTQKLPFYKY